MMQALEFRMRLLTKFRSRVVLIAAWAIVLAVGIQVLLRYASTPGVLAQPPAEWPVHAPTEAARGRATLVIFVHPQCPCSRSTLGELARIISTCRGQVEATVFFYFPSETGIDWAHTDLWDTAVSIPALRVLADPDAAAARRFGARTSGQVLFYDVQGHLAFNGGITAFRGHSGDNDGRDAIVSLLRGKVPQHRTTPVFGCALYGETRSTWNPVTF